MKITRGDLLRLHSAIEGMKAETRAAWPLKFKLALALNRRAIQPIADAFRESLNAVEDVRQQYEQERVKLITMHARLDENGTLLTNVGPAGDTRAEVRDQGVFEIAMRALMVDWQPKLDAAAREQADGARELEQEQDETTTLRMVSCDDVPADLALAALDALIPMLTMVVDASAAVKQDEPAPAPA
jgi:hypothetical protein